MYNCCHKSIGSEAVGSSFVAVVEHRFDGPSWYASRLQCSRLCLLPPTVTEFSVKTEENPHNIIKLGFIFVDFRGVLCYICTL
jgi:hypothetical protein